jgi:hypothetical protein
MPVLRNAKHEAFAQAVAIGKNQDEAYAAIGFKPHRQNAHRLMTRDDIKARVLEIKNRVSEKAEWSAADRLASLKKIHDKGLKDDHRVAIAAINEANKMMGSYAPVKQEIDLRHSFTDLPDDELDREIQKLTGRAAK